MSHYTIGMRSSPRSQDLARAADKARSAALKSAFLMLARILFLRPVGKLRMERD